MRDDLRLALRAVLRGDRGGEQELVRFELSTDEDGMELRADDVTVDRESADLDGWTGRFALIRALFPDADVSDTSVRIRVPLTS